MLAHTSLERGGGFGAALAGLAPPAPRGGFGAALAGLVQRPELPEGFVYPRLAGPAPVWAPPPWLWPSDIPLAELLSYDFILLAFSGGKDSLFCLLYLLALGVPASRIELWHHLVDGEEGHSTLMDWPCTSSYCEAVARAIGVPLYRSWREGGFEREMLKDKERTAPIVWENPDGTLGRAGGEGDPRTRLMFPQASADLKVRWCSSTLKIEVMAAAIRNQPRFEGARTLVVTGERAEESASRRKEAPFETHRADLRDAVRKEPRHVDHWRPAHDRSERDVWDLIGFYRCNYHPAYRLGFSRVSCATCIFGNADQWATLRAILRSKVQRIADYEADFGVTISRKKDAIKYGGTGRYLTVLQLADRGTPYPDMHHQDVATAIATTFDEPIFLSNWTLPAGAFRHTPGPN